MFEWVCLVVDFPDRSLMTIILVNSTDPACCNPRIRHEVEYTITMTHSLEQVA